MLYGEAGLRDLREAGHGVLDYDGAVFGLRDPSGEDAPGWVADRTEIALRLAAKPVDDGVARPVWAAVAELARCCADAATADEPPGAGRTRSGPPSAGRSRSRRSRSGQPCSGEPRSGEPRSGRPHSGEPGAAVDAHPDGCHPLDIHAAGAGDSATVLITAASAGLAVCTVLAGRLPRPPVALVAVDALPPIPTELIERDVVAALLANWPDAAPGPAAALVSALVRADRLDLLSYWQERLRTVAGRLADAIADPRWTDPDALAGLVDDAGRLLDACLDEALPRRQTAPHPVSL